MATTTIPLTELHQALLPAVGFDPEALRARVRVLALLARAEWIRLAKERLRSTAADYVRGIQPVEWVGSTLARVALVGPWPNVLEHGKAAWDLRETLLVVGKVAKVRISREGFRYLAVPFRHQAPGGGGARVMGVAYAGLLGEEAARALGRAIHRRAKQLEGTRSAPGGSAGGGQTRWGGRLATDELDVPRLRERHAGDLFAGMVRKEKTYARATQSSYATWRMISDNPASFRSDDGGQNWRHPGIPAAGLLRQVQAHLEAETPRVLAAGASG